jgi:hypothetical protein
VDGRVVAEKLARRYAEQQGVANLTGGAGYGDSYWRCHGRSVLLSGLFRGDPTEPHRAPR